MLLLLPGLAFAQEPEPGVVPVDDFTVEDLVIAARAGDAQAALKTFLDGHAAHKKGDADTALLRYVAFMGMPGRLELPPRYVTTVKQRLEPLLDAVRKRYEAAVTVYRKDGAKGLAALTALAERYSGLPEGKTARAIAESDALRGAIEQAKGQEDKKAAAKELEAAIKRLKAAVYMYEAKTLLIELGGPDLFEKFRDEDGKPREVKREADEPEKEEEIEVSDDG